MRGTGDGRGGGQGRVSAFRSQEALLRKGVRDEQAPSGVRSSKSQAQRPTLQPPFPRPAPLKEKKKEEGNKGRVSTSMQTTRSYLDSARA